LGAIRDLLVGLAAGVPQVSLDIVVAYDESVYLVKRGRLAVALVDF
jgi:hypothetical protein